MAEVKNSYDGGRGADLRITPEAILKKRVAGIAYITGSDIAAALIFVGFGCCKINRVYKIHM